MATGNVTHERRIAEVKHHKYTYHERTAKRRRRRLAPRKRPTRRDATLLGAISRGTVAAFKAKTGLEVQLCDNRDPTRIFGDILKTDTLDI
ncbi:unnamed protein product [Angiostrongylus costaricensis]|uniref:30S ribosomal protein S18 n=1 Tax=Angiostrongylus costaricensis TaxID=334426 RepID=A0A0R3PSD6_ANGCS|nr:unnamed protein product [Angiostrongylus costaricensis]